MTEAKNIAELQNDLLIPARTRGVALWITGFALFALIAELGAAERLVDYDPIEAVGASWTYRMLNSQGQVVGDLSVEVIEEEPGGMFRSETESNMGGMLGLATFWQRINEAGERVVDKIEFETRFEEMVVDSSSIEYGEPIENFSSLSLGETGTVSTTFTQVMTGFDGESQSRTGTVEATTTLEAFEEVTVPVGTFDTIRMRNTDTIIFDDDPQNSIVTEEIVWHAKGIGRVQRQFLDKDPEDAHHRDELVAYSVPGEPGEPDSGFTAWVSEHGLPEGKDGPGANPSGDGIPNVMKYALGLDPRKAVRDQLPRGEFEAINEEKYMVMDVPLNSEAKNITVFIEVSSNLETWESGPEHLAVIDETGSFIRVRDNTPVSSAEERFFRLRVELNGDE